jgi:hypothetical protein
VDDDWFMGTLFALMLLALVGMFVLGWREDRAVEREVEACEAAGGEAVRGDPPEVSCLDPSAVLSP